MRKPFMVLLLFWGMLWSCANSENISPDTHPGDAVDANITEEINGQADILRDGQGRELVQDIIRDNPGSDRGTTIKDVCINLPDDLKPQVMEMNGIKVVILKGSAYEMGRQHARFFKKELEEGVKYVNHSEMGLLMKAARNTGMDKVAMQYSYKEIIDECRGMADETGGEWPVDMCVVLSYGDVILDALKSGKTGTKCSQFVVFGKATKNGEVLHGRNLDWDKIDYLLKYPIIIIRIPDNGIPNMTIGYPGNVAPYTGINACGLSVGMNEAYAKGDIKKEGRSHNQMVRLILERCHNVQEAEAFIKTQKQASAENFGMADTSTGRVFEMTATHMGIRNPVKGVLYVTNHFESPEMKSLNDSTITKNSSSVKRFVRLHQLLDPDGKDTLYGNIDVAAAVSVLRDRHDPYTGEEYGTGVFDNDSSLATNGNIYSMVFENKSLTVFLAIGKKTPVPSNPYYPFNLKCILGITGCQQFNVIQ